MVTKKYTISFLSIIIVLGTISCKRPVEFNPNDLVDARDGNRYSTVQYGGQRWMAENLNYNLNNSKVNLNNPISEYGRLYTFEQASVVCPEGWHLPTDSEWKTLEFTIGMGAGELNLSGYRGGQLGRSLKSTTGWVTKNGSNDLEFNAYPSGSYDSTKGSYEELGFQAYFWTASDSSVHNGWTRSFTKDFDGIYRDTQDKIKGLSCRCIQD